MPTAGNAIDFGPFLMERWAVEVTFRRSAARGQIDDGERLRLRRLTGSIDDTEWVAYCRWAEQDGPRALGGVNFAVASACAYAAGREPPMPSVELPLLLEGDGPSRSFRDTELQQLLGARCAYIHASTAYLLSSDPILRPGADPVIGAPPGAPAFDGGAGPGAWRLGPGTPAWKWARANEALDALFAQELLLRSWGLEVAVLDPAGLAAFARAQEQARAQEVRCLVGPALHEVIRCAKESAGATAPAPPGPSDAIVVEGLLPGESSSPTYLRVDLRFDADNECRADIVQASLSELLSGGVRRSSTGVWVEEMCYEMRNRLGDVVHETLCTIPVAGGQSFMLSGPLPDLTTFTPLDESMDVVQDADRQLIPMWRLEEAARVQREMGSGRSQGKDMGTGR